jgi:hypothetical protein
MTSLEQAIKEAVENGYQVERFKDLKRPLVAWKAKKADTYVVGNDGFFSIDLEVNLSKALLSPSFWQALGKARTPKNLPANSSPRATDARLLNDWRTAWHRFIDHLAEGKTAEEFFAAL